MKSKLSANVQGVIFLVSAMFIFSLQNIAIKSISGDYPVLQIVIIRSIVALPCSYFFFYREGRRGWPNTGHWRMEILRGFLLFLSYNTYFMGLSALPLAEAASIRFSAPIIITFFSVVILRESVGIRRWSALFVGFAGVLFIVRPGSASFNIGSLFVLAATVTYALSLMLTRSLREIDSSATMAFYGTLVYLGAAFVLAPLVASIGEIPDAHPSIAFLLRSWSRPTPFALGIMAGLGFVWATGMYFVAKAYTLALASVAAPFEFTTLPINVMWGFLIWREIPTLYTWVGAFLTLGSVLYVLYREARVKAKANAVPLPNPGD